MNSRYKTSRSTVQLTLIIMALTCVQCRYFIKKNSVKVTNAIQVSTELGYENNTMLEQSKLDYEMYIEDARASAEIIQSKIDCFHCHAQRRDDINSGISRLFELQQFEDDANVLFENRRPVVASLVKLHRMKRSLKRGDVTEIANNDIHRHIKLFTLFIINNSNISYRMLSDYANYGSLFSKAQWHKQRQTTNIQIEMLQDLISRETDDMEKGLLEKRLKQKKRQHKRIAESLIDDGR